MHKFSRSNTREEIDSQCRGEEQILIPGSPIWPRPGTGVLMENNGDISPTTPGIYYTSIKSGNGSTLSRSR